jgi:hypothetical protein
MARMLRRAGKVLAWVAVGFAVIQLVPYGRVHDNPPVTAEPGWDSPRTRELAVRACFDCHSNETQWPRYASVAPLSWVVQHDVAMGREVINFSTWDRRFAVAPSSSTSILTGNMPPTWYRMAHPEADLSAAESSELARGLDATLRDDPTRI